MSNTVGLNSAGALTNLITVLQQIATNGTAELTVLKQLAAGITVNYAASTWTPALAFGGASTGVTYSSLSGKYTQIGGLIVVEFSIVLSAVGSSTGAATITGLPVSSVASGSGIMGAYSGLSGISGPIILTVPAGSAISLLASGSTASTALTNSNFGGSSNVQGSVIYWAS